MVVPSDAESTPSAAEIDAIASPRFSNSFRGWNPDEVRVHLVGVAEIVRALTQRQGELERLLAEAEAAARRADLTRLDPDEVDRVLGEETAHVLRTARAAAAEIEAKAKAQAELLARQAADDAAEKRARAEADAKAIRAEAEETAAAVRAAGEAHLADVQAAGEADLAARREELEAELAAERQAARDEAAAELATAQEHATRVRREADEEATRVRADAQAEAEASRAEVEAELARSRAASEDELRTLTERSMAQVAEAERMRDRVLTDLSRKRRAARQHLEQLHAGRDRLITAYEVIRATTDQATGELAVVLGDAKRVADEAARRIGAEALPTPEEMLAELDLARSAGLPIVASPSPAPAPADADSAPADSDTVEADRAPADGTAASEATPEAVAEVTDRVDDTSSGGDAATGTPTVTESDADVASGGDVAEGAEHAEQDRPVESAPEDASSTNHRRHGRRTKRRHDPLGGEELPDVPMPPVDASADFERVRVVAEDAPDAPEVAAPTGSATTTATAASALAISEGGPDAPTGREATDASGSSTGGDAAGDAVSGIFARLRAEAEKQPDADASGAAASAPEDAEDGGTAEAPADESAAATSGSAEESVPMPPDPPVEAARDAGDERLASVFERRDAAIDEVARRLAKHLKRNLSDQQSGLLDELRRHRGTPSVDDVLGPSETFAAEWVEVIRDDLAGAVASGVALAGDLDPDASDHGDVDVTAVTHELIDSIAEPLRARLVFALGEGATDDEDDQVAAIDDLELADRIRACYREWRGARLAAAVADACARAFGLGIRAAIPAATGLRWYCGPGDAPCSDCNDNQLEGPIAAGDAFPTGQSVAPAHPGCRCLALPELV